MREKECIENLWQLDQVRGNPLLRWMHERAVHSIKLVLYLTHYNSVRFSWAGAGTALSDIMIKPISAIELPQVLKFSLIMIKVNTCKSGSQFVANIKNEMMKTVRKTFTRL